MTEALKTGSARLLAVYLSLCLLLGLFTGCSMNLNDSKPTTEAPAETLDPTVDYDGLNTLSAYTVDALPAEDSRLDTVVATCGGYSLTNRQLQIYYYTQIFAFMTQVNQMAASGYNISDLGLDLEKPLSQQPCSEAPGLSWEQYFLMMGLDLFHHTAAAAATGEAEGFTLSQEAQTELAEIQDTLEEDAQRFGYADMEAYLRESFGAGIRPDDYLEYTNLYVYVMNYQDDCYGKITWSDEDLLEYFHNNSDRYQGLTEQANVNVRHILIEPADTDGDGETSDAEKADALARAETILALYRENPTEETFATLANANSSDPGSNTKGGLYEDVYPGQMVPSFNDWCFDPDRHPGDVDIVESDYGYHVMYFVSQTDHYLWKSVVERDYPSTRMETAIREMMEANPLEVDYAEIVIGPIPALLEPAGE